MKPDNWFGPETLSLPKPRGDSRAVLVDSPMALPVKGVISRAVSPFRIRVFVFTALSLTCAFILRLAYLQILEGSSLRAIAEGNRLRMERIEASRGILYDRQGTPLVENTPMLSLVADIAKLPQNSLAQEAEEMLLRQLLPRLSATEAKLLAEPQGNDMLVLYDGLTLEEAVRIRAHQDELPGVNVVTAQSRKLRGQTAFSHVIGYVGRIDRRTYGTFRNSQLRYRMDDIVGKSGLELTYETSLRGRPGRRVLEVDARGVMNSVVADEEAIPGEDIHTTMIFELQTWLAARLAETVRAAGGTGGAAVVLDPRHGEVLALVSVPTFDANAISRGQTQLVADILASPAAPLFNRAVSGQYPTGSTIKPVIAAAALQERIITPSATILSTGGIVVGDWWFPDWKTGGHGWVDVRQALAQSVNTYFYTIGGGTEDRQGLGVERIVHYARAFGFGARTGIDVPGEAEGFLPTPAWKDKVKGEGWYIGDTYHLSIGQGDILATPLQVARAISVFANGGKLIEPHFLYSDIKLQPTRDLVADGIISQSVLREVRRGLREVVLLGSARSLSTLPISVAGKTGTAEGMSGKKPHAWFTGFAPADNPEIVVMVLIEQGGEGSVVAVPLTREIFEWWYANRKSMISNQ